MPNNTPEAPSNLEITMKTSRTPAPGSARDRAMAALLKGTRGETEAPKSVEETIKAIESEENPVEAGQNDNSETVATTEEVEAAATEETVAEAATEVAKPAAKSEPLSPQYAMLARKEKALRQREMQLKARESEFAKSSAPKVEAPKDPNAFDPNNFISKDALTKNPFGVLNQLGLSYDKLVDIVTNGPSHEQISTQMEIQNLREELKALRTKSEETSKTFEQSQADQDKQAVNLMKNEAKKLIASDESLELIRLESPDYIIGEITSLIEKTYNEDGEFLSVAEAALQIEEHLAEEAIKRSQSKKIQSRLQAKVAPAAAPAKQNGQSQKPAQLKTLTNAVGTSRPLSSRERAILAMQGKLNS